MDYPLWGREDELRRVVSEITTTSDSMLIEIVAPDGAGSSRFLTHLEFRLDEMGISVHRASADPLNEFAPGSIAEELGDLPESIDRQALLVIDAQLADATSLGVVSRHLVEVPGTIAVIDHAPSEGSRELRFANLRRNAERHGSVLVIEFAPIEAAAVADSLGIDLDAAQLALRAAGGTDEGLVGVLRRLAGGEGGVASLGDVLSELAEDGVPLRDVSPDDRQLIELAAVADRPLSVGLAASILGITDRALLDAGDRLVQAGFLRESRDGYGPVPEPLRSTIRNQLGEARSAHLHAEMAGALERADPDRHQAHIGTLYRRAGRWAEALPFLASAGLDLVESAHLEEAFPLVDGALEAVGHGAMLDHERHAQLLVARALHRRAGGFSLDAAEDLEHAVRLATGPAKVDALGYLAAVHNDQQRPQVAEAVIASAEWEASRLGLEEKLGSLHTFRSLIAERLGFGAEADRLIEIGQLRVDRHGTDQQQFNAKSNRAWITFDRGQVGIAEQLFAELADAAESNADAASHANQLAWLARARFGVGNPKGGLGAIEQANRIADQHDLTSVRFLAAIALAEGASAYGRSDVALGAIEEEQSIVSLLLGAWQNGTHYRRAVALLASGETDEAANAIRAAIQTSPSGADGVRWRSRCAAVQMVVDQTAGREWRGRAAENLTDELLVANWFGPAADLMAARARIEGDRDLGLDASALAMQLANPMAAAAAVESAGAWDDPAGATVAAKIQGIAANIPPEWDEAWRSLPHVRSALSTDPDLGEPSTLNERVAEALETGGLSNPETILSPAQRQAGGLVRRRPTRRSRRIGPVAIAAAIGAVALVGAIGGAVFNAVAGGDSSEEDPPVVAGADPVATTAGTAPTTLSLAERVIATPERFAGQHQYRGGPTLNGISDATGIATADGRFWIVETTDAIRSSPTVRGSTVYVGGGDGEIHLVELGSGAESTISMDVRIDGPILVADVSLGGATSSGTEPIAYAVDRDGQIVALRATGLELGRRNVDGPVRAGPVSAGESIVVATGAGRVYAVTPDLITESWVYPIEGSVGSFTHTPAVADGLIYAGTDDGLVYALDASTGTEICRFELPEGLSASIVVAEGRVWIPAGNSGVWVMEERTCNPPQAGQVVVPTGVRITTSPVILGDTIYIGSGQLMVAINMSTGENLWTVPTGDVIESSPLLSNGVLYFGSNDGSLYAADVEMGVELWSFPTGGAIKTSPAVIDGAVIVTNNNGDIIAVGADN